MHGLFRKYRLQVFLLCGKNQKKGLDENSTCIMYLESEKLDFNFQVFFIRHC